MMGSSKILTVSYGTFSCTLEGFDDSFGTMKAIAEYFQKLASEDRYFGAEPATPDADMLAHIASSEIRGKVAAKVEDGNVTLRPEITAAVQEDVQEDVQEIDAVISEDAVQIEEPAVESIKEEVAPVKAELVKTDLGEIDNAPLESEKASTESVAAKLRRIRAVVSQNKGDLLSGSEFAEDQHANGFVGTDEEAEFEDDTFAEDDEDAATEVATPEPEYRAEEDVSEQIAEIVEEVAESTLEQEDASDAYFEDEIEEITEGTIAEQIEPEAEYTADDADDNDAALANVMSAMNSATNQTEDRHEERAFPEIEDNFEDADYTEKSEADILKNVQGTLGETSLSAEDEADLVSELASIELEQDDLEIGHADLDLGINTMLRSERADRALGTNEGKDTDVPMERLMDEASAKLETDDSTRRRSVISHLRAAVAATVADRKDIPENDAEPADDAELYRLDLADAVKPEHSNAEAADPTAPVKPGRPVVVRKRRTERPTERPSPLVLVSEQRVDDTAEVKTPEPARATIRPRRIVKSAEHEAPQKEIVENVLTGGENMPQDSQQAGENIFADSTSFADFAEKMGATSMPDILEAAAAYNAYVEGQPDFGRPQIMRQVASFAGKEQFNREEGLRSFGQLLRQGKIIKVNRGRFEIADTTRFKPADRYAGE